MRFGRIGVLVASLSFVLVPAWPRQTTQSSTQPASGLQASTVLAQSLQAMAGTTSISDVTLTGTARRIVGADDEAGAATLKALVTGEARMDFNFPSGQRSEIHTISGGVPAGQWIGPDGKAHAISSHNLVTDSSWFFPPLTLTKWLSSQSYSMTLVGQETRNGQAVTHLTLSQPAPAGSGLPSDMAALMQHLSQTEIYLDVSSGLPVAMEFNIHPDNNALLDIPVEISFSDYQSLGGVQAPLHVQEYWNNSLILDLQFTSLVLNSGLSASNFQLQ